jgi:cell division transport system permease protein
MLKRVRILWGHHLQAVRSGARVVARSPLATLMTVLVIGLTLTLPSLFWVMIDQMKQLTLGWQNSGHISLYLRVSLPPSDALELLSQVRRTEGVGHATLTTPEEGLVELQQQEGMQDMMRYLPENPLPAVIDVIPAIGMDHQEKMQRLYGQLKAYPQVAEARLDMQWVRRLQAVLRFSGTVVYGLMMLLALAVVFITSNTLRLAVHHRYEEIQVLKLIGAKRSFIIRPFLYSGVGYGLSGALVALLLVHLFLFSLTRVVNQLFDTYDIHHSMVGLSMSEIVFLFFSSGLLGWFAAWMSVSRQLAIIEQGTIHT